MGYRERPWLRQYPPGMPADIDVPFESALEMFTATVDRAPDAPLVRYFGTTLSVADVDRAGDAFAAALVSFGVGRGDRVALYLQNIPQFVIAVVGTWKAGAIVVPVNPMNKARELAYVLEDSGAAVLVTLESLYDEVARDVVAEPRRRARRRDDERGRVTRRTCRRCSRRRARPCRAARWTSPGSSRSTTALGCRTPASGRRTWRS